MKKVKLYSATYCPFCVRAKQLLESKSADMEIINVDENPELREQISKETGFSTVPMIFIDDEFVGGFQELQALENNGELDQKLS